MLDAQDFRRWLKQARASLNLYECATTYNYGHAHEKGLPVVYENKYSLLQWLDRWSPEEAESIRAVDLGDVQTDEADLVESMLRVIGDFTCSIKSTGERYRANAGIYETLLDYRYVRQYAPENFRLLDFGAGCGRHGLAFLLTGNQGCYVAADCVELLYLSQNALFSFAAPRRFVEWLDYRIEGRQPPALAELPPGTLAHVPTWEEAVLTPNFFDVMVANHVIDELAAGDARRLLEIAGTAIRPGGILYARGTLENPGKMALNSYHGLDINAELGRRGFERIVFDPYPARAYHVAIWQRC
jgi:SAM-dependent methyltransferase